MTRDKTDETTLDEDMNDLDPGQSETDNTADTTASTPQISREKDSSVSCVTCHAGDTGLEGNAKATTEPVGGFVSQERRDSSGYVKHVGKVCAPYLLVSTTDGLHAVSAGASIADRRSASRTKSRA